jgi:hypothetical protein
MTNVLQIFANPKYDSFEIPVVINTACIVVRCAMLNVVQAAGGLIKGRNMWLFL